MAGHENARGFVYPDCGRANLRTIVTTRNDAGVLRRKLCVCGTRISTIEVLAERVGGYLRPAEEVQA